MTKTTYRVMNLNDNSDFSENYVENMETAYKMAFQMAQDSMEALGIEMREAMEHVVITTVVTEHQNLADMMGLK